ncbi:MAG: restriction endonuclease subunit S [candidate division NC10 bacterium]|nr:restriction endonuclease subunit S [candidate division NC10 bacterium]
MNLITKRGHSRPTLQVVTLEQPVQIGSGIPDGWRIAPLRSLCLATELTDPAKRPEIPFQYVDVSAVSNELWKITASAEHLRSTAPSRARKVVKANDVIFATVRPTLKRIALVPDNLDGQIVSTAFCVLRADPTLADSHFIYYSLLTDEFIDRMANLQRGASYPAVSDGNVLEQEIAVPPLPEQRAIAAVLSKIQAAVEVQDKIVNTLKELKAATMAKLFREGLRGEPLKQTEIGEIPEDWEVVRVGDLFTVELGKMLSPKSRRGINPRPYLRNKNVQWGRLDLSEVFQMDFTDHEFERFCLKPGDILVCEGGEPGRTAVWGREIPDCCYQKALHRLRPKDSTRVLTRYYLYWATAAFTVLRIYKPTGTKTTIAHLPKEKLEVMEMALPQLSEQERIVEILDKLDCRLLQAETKAAVLKTMFSSMLHLLMTGQVRLNDLQLDEVTYG